MFNSCDFRRTLKVAIAGLAILATVPFQASGQSVDQYPTSQDEIAQGRVFDLSNDEMEKGMAAYQSGKLDEAILHFQHVVLLNSDANFAKIWLGNALTRKVVPGVDTPENLMIAQQAINLYQEVLSHPYPGGIVHMPFGTDPRTIKVQVMRQIARINFSINKQEESKAWQKRVLAEEPKDAEATFAVGVIDGMEAQQNAQAALAQAGLKDDYEGNAKAPANVMDAIKAQNGALVEEALQYLNQAVENRPDYDKAMTFLGLTYRRKADLDWGNEAARKDDVAKAKEWQLKAMETRRANEEKKSTGSESVKP